MTAMCQIAVGELHDECRMMRDIDDVEMQDRSDTRSGSGRLENVPAWSSGRSRGPKLDCKEWMRHEQELLDEPSKCLYIHYYSLLMYAP